ncbi:MAG: transcription elongation factor GreA [Myxococcales bacterium]|nr:transcription elongation factor GreA [Myxococcales bacterium]
MSDRIPMSRNGYEKLEEELRRLKSEERPQNVRDIEEAREHGDISENAEFHAAKERQSHIDGRIRQVEDRMARAQIIDTSAEETPTEIRFGVTAVLLDAESEEEVTYTLVGEDESDASEGKISVTSPIARALLGKRVADSISVRVPKGTREFEVLEIRIDRAMSP